MSRPHIRGVGDIEWFVFSRKHTQSSLQKTKWLRRTTADCANDLCFIDFEHSGGLLIRNLTRRTQVHVRHVQKTQHNSFNLVFSMVETKRFPSAPTEDRFCLRLLFPLTETTRSSPPAPPPVQAAAVAFTSIPLSL